MEHETNITDLEKEIAQKLEAFGVFTEEEKTEDKVEDVATEKRHDEEEREEDEAKIVPDEEADNEEKEKTIEEQALASGWNPDGEKTAGEWVRTESMFKEIKARGKEIKELQATLAELKEFAKQQKEVGYKNAMEELQSQRRAAIAEGDVEAVENFDAEIEKHKTGEAEKVEQHPAAVAFGERHRDWIDDYSYEAMEIKDFVRKRDGELLAFGLDPEKHIETIEKDLRVKFPTRFAKEEPEKDTPTTNMVESGTSGTARSGKKKNQFGFEHLNKDQKHAARMFERQGVMKVDEYIAALVEAGELK